jgi:hypothetical protein
MPNDTSDQNKNTSTAFSEAAVEYGRRLSEFGFMNTTAAFEGAQRLVTVKSPQEYFQTLTDLTREQSERISEQIEELSAMMPFRTRPERNSTGTGFWD